MRAHAMAIAGAAAVLLVALSGCSAAPSASGTWGTPSVQGKPYLDLHTDGSVSGSDGCNRLTGSWKQSGATVTFGHLASTLIACQGVDTWLSQAGSATISGSTMTVLNESKKHIGSLTQNK